jgi:hypothetical protein
MWGVARTLFNPRGCKVGKAKKEKERKETATKERSKDAVAIGY